MREATPNAHLIRRQSVQYCPKHAISPAAGRAVEDALPVVCPTKHQGFDLRYDVGGRASDDGKLYGKSFISNPIFISNPVCLPRGKHEPQLSVHVA